jgi:hypothetical protein
MRHSLPVEARVRAVWQTQVAAARKTPGLLPLLLRQRHELLARFAAAYQQLRTLPKWIRRRRQRATGGALPGVVPAPPLDTS